MAGGARNREKNYTPGTRRREARTSESTTKGERQEKKGKHEERRAGSGRHKGGSIRKWIWGMVNQSRRSQL